MLEISANTAFPNNCGCQNELVPTPQLHCDRGKLWWDSDSTETFERKHGQGPLKFETISPYPFEVIEIPMKKISLHWFARGELQHIPLAVVNLESHDRNYMYERGHFELANDPRRDVWSMSFQTSVSPWFLEGLTPSISIRSRIDSSCIGKVKVFSQVATFGVEEWLTISWQDILWRSVETWASYLGCEKCRLSHSNRCHCHMTLAPTLDGSIAEVSRINHDCIILYLQMIQCIGPMSNLRLPLINY